MEVTVFSGNIKGTVQAQPSKSLTQRAIAAALLRKGVSVIENIGHADDEKTALRLAECLGAEIRFLEDNTLEVKSTFPQSTALSKVLDCGESGLAMRLFTPIAALRHEKFYIVGQESLLKRPMDGLFDYLPKLNVHLVGKNNKAPFSIKGPLQPQCLVINGQESSQYLTGLLFAFAGANARQVNVTVNSLNSRPYVDLSLSVLKAFGLTCPKVQGNHYFLFGERNSMNKLKPFRYKIEGDWSSATFLLVAAAIGGDLIINGLFKDSLQGDRAIIDVLRHCGAKVLVGDDEVVVKSSSLNAFEFDATQCPDLFPPLTALAANCSGLSVIHGTQRLIHKESDRAKTLVSEFRKLGIEINHFDDKLFIQGGSISGGEVDSHRDHRLAMACAVAGLSSMDPVTIKGAECVRKSYPDFWEDLQQLSVRCHLFERP